MRKPMIKKNQLRGIAAGIFCLGVLLGGIGTGIALLEFSDFTYQSVPAPEEDYVKETFDYRIMPEEGEMIRLRNYFGGTICRMKEQEDIPVNSVEIAVVYNSKLCEVATEKGKDNENGEIWINLYLSHVSSEMEMFMRHKDEFLNGLKNRELRDYQEEYVRSVEYRINPADSERFRIIY